MQASPLAELKDIHLPEATSFWPLAYGWWLLLVIVIGLLISITIWQIRRWRISLAKRQALSEIAVLTSSNEQWPQHLQKLIRRLAISYFPQENVAQLHGRHWTQFLLKQLKQNQREKCQNEFEVLANAQYQLNSPDLDLEKQKAAVNYWVNHALPPKRRKALDTQQPNTSGGRENV